MDETNVVDMKLVQIAESVDKIYASVDEIEARGGLEVEYAIVDGFKPAEKFRIGSVTAGDIIEWTEANEGEAKRTAGLRLITKSLVGPEPDNIRYADHPKHIQRFRRMRHKDTERLVREILKLNGMSVKGDAEVKKD